ncbi:MAG: helix-turn-helix transcriptional regulator [Dermatophilus congolensis]|nr:helix-turn-helix transcriptional regulator [Dermatophilus congolensis]
MAKEEGKSGSVLGAYIRGQRQMADMSLRQLASLSNVSNAYLSQVERGLHQPSLKVLGSIAGALNIAPESLLAQVGLGPGRGAAAGEPEDSQARTLAALRSDTRLTREQREAMITMYKAFLSTS